MTGEKLSNKNQNKEGKSDKKGSIDRVGDYRKRAPAKEKEQRWS